MRAFQIRVRDSNRAQRGVVGEPVKFETILRHNSSRSSTWTLKLPADDPIATRFTPGWGVRLMGEQGQVMSGHARTIQESVGQGQGGDADAGGDPEAGISSMLTISGREDTGVLGRRVAWPDPQATITESGMTFSSGATHYAVSGAAETALRTLVDTQAGPSAQTHRHIPGLILAADQGRGATVEDEFRFTPLLEATRGLATRGGVGYRIAQVGTDLQFQVYEPQDLSGKARYGLGLGNLNSYSYEVSPPEVTDVIVGVGGQGDAREFYRFTRVDPVWPDIRVEQFVDRRDLDPAKANTQTLAQQEAQQRLDEGSGTAKVTFEPIDTNRLVMFRDVGLGDTVKLELARGSLTEVIREIRVTLDQQQGWRAVPVVGADGATSSPQIYQAVGRLIRDMQHLETAQ